MPPAGFVFSSQSGCLLPTLIIFNLFFGRFIFNTTGLWLSIEGILVLLFMIKVYIFTRKITKQLWPNGYGSASGSRNSRPAGGNQGQVVDVESEVIEEKHKLK